MRHRVAALALPGVVTFDLGCAIQVFGWAPGPQRAPGAYDLTICGPGGRRVATGDGFAMTLAHGLSVLQQADTIVVPGYVTAPAEAPDPRVLLALRAAYERGARIMSICVGAFALAHAGLLDGRRATTHWAAAEMLAAQFPTVEVDPDVLYVDSGQILTSAGLAAGLDLALHVVRSDHGAEHAAQIARWNVIAPHRDGGQGQFAARPVPAEPADGLGPTWAWALDHLDRPLTLADLAAHACCSERSLNRRFRDQIGCSPKQWLIRARIDRARELLETTDLTVETVAARVGFPTPAALRAQFSALVHTTPTAYRATFRGSRRSRPLQQAHPARSSRRLS